jgi:hypothetical protein
VISGDPPALDPTFPLENAFKQSAEGEILLVVVLIPAPKTHACASSPFRQASLWMLRSAAPLKNCTARTSATTNHKYLGLIIARQLVKLMAGEGIQSGGSQAQARG